MTISQVQPWGQFFSVLLAETNAVDALAALLEEQRSPISKCISYTNNPCGQNNLRGACPILHPRRRGLNWTNQFNRMCFSWFFYSLHEGFKLNTFNISASFR
ncbi:MAG: hypothetical protein HC852_19355 [Acaryochloridaceae cyanobacterium RU_4_10]|nr:hypothetical protein [Acaryochloridaceae cyanobacterium RU_4_10]